RRSAGSWPIEWREALQIDVVIGCSKPRPVDRNNRPGLCPTHSWEGWRIGKISVHGASASSTAGHSVTPGGSFLSFGELRASPCVKEVCRALLGPVPPVCVGPAAGRGSYVLSPLGPLGSLRAAFSFRTMLLNHQRPLAQPKSFIRILLHGRLEGCNGNTQVIGINQHPPNLAVRPHPLDSEGVIFECNFDDSTVCARRGLIIVDVIREFLE